MSARERRRPMAKAYGNEYVAFMLDITDKRVTKEYEMNHLKKISILLLALPLLAWTPSSFAHADDYWPYVTITCDNAKQSLSIAEHIAESETAIPKTLSTYGLDGMLEFVPAGESDGVMKIKAPLKKNCRIGKADFRLVILPHLYNPRVQGMCGAAAPSVQMSVWRNGKLLLDKLLFRVHCPTDGATDTEIEAASFSELGRRVVFAIREKNHAGQKSLSFDDLPNFDRSNFFRQ
jgi:hypothetical protein